MLNCIVIGLGGFIGPVLRYLAGKLTLAPHTAFPLNTLLINVLGSFAIGLIAALVARDPGLNPRLVLFARVGLCGGFTTFSTFSLETFELLRAGSYAAAGLYAVLSAVLCVLAVVLAHMLVKA